MSTPFTPGVTFHYFATPSFTISSFARLFECCYGPLPLQMAEINKTKYLLPPTACKKTEDFKRYRTNLELYHDQDI
jgi:hypothetical protein